MQFSELCFSLFLCLCIMCTESNIPLNNEKQDVNHDERLLEMDVIL